MKKYLPLSVLVFLFLQANAQLGISVSTDFNYTPGWQVVVENYIAHRHWDFMRNGTSAAVDYSLPVKSPAWKIRPAIHATRMTATSFPHSFDVYGTGIQGNIAFQLFHRIFSEENPGLPGRLWLQLSPGIDFLLKKYILPAASEPFELQHFIQRSLAPNIGGNLMLEFKLTELLSLSPYAGIRFYPNLVWKDFTKNITEGKMEESFDRTTWRQYNLGLRIGLELGNKNGSATGN